MTEPFDSVVTQIEFLITSLIPILDNIADRMSSDPSAYQQARHHQRHASHFPFPSMEKLSHSHTASLEGTAAGLRGFESRSHAESGVRTIAKGKSGTTQSDTWKPISASPLNLPLVSPKSNPPNSFRHSHPFFPFDKCVNSSVPLLICPWSRHPLVWLKRAFPSDLYRPHIMPVFVSFISWNPSSTPLKTKTSVTTFTLTNTPTNTHVINRVTHPAFRRHPPKNSLMVSPRRWLWFRTL